MTITVLLWLTALFFVYYAIGVIIMSMDVRKKDHNWYLPELLFNPIIWPVIIIYRMGSIPIYREKDNKKEKEKGDN